MIIKGGTLVYPDKSLQADVLVKDGKIGRIAAKIDATGEETINASGFFVFPGLIDAHVHLREPGGTHKEDFFTGTQAALAGGVTSVVCMPNTSPSIDSIQMLGEWKKTAEKCVCDYGFHFGGAHANHADAAQAAKDPLVASLKIFMGSSTGNLLVKEFAPFYQHFASWPAGKPITVHAEDEDAVKHFTGLVKEKNAGATAADHNRCRPPLCAELAVKRAISIAAETGRRLHVCHISSAGEIEAVRQAKKAGLKVTCEAAPHHMFLSEEDAARLGNFARMNPPLRSKADAEAVWKAVADGTVDCIATDHAPHTREEKEKGYWDAPSGVTGLETMLPLLLDAVNAKRLTLEKVVELCCAAPARIFGMKGKGALVAGADADFTLVDLKGTTKISPETLYTKCKWSPWDGKTFKGRIARVFLRGEEAFDGENVISKAGRPLAF